MATRARLPTPPQNLEAAGGGPVIVWRTWLIAPDPRHRKLPLLTGVMGFPWNDPEVDAKCIIQDRNPEGSVFVSSRIDRHHPRIPDPNCTCGLYATREDLQAPPRRLLPRGIPIATGFAELSGPLLADASHIRAGHARILGPLSIAAGRPPVVAGTLRRLGATMWPRRVEIIRDQYRVLWSSRHNNEFAEWQSEIARRLRHRYSVAVA